MRELDKALADIVTIRSHIAATTAFRGLGPGALAATGVVALAATVAQALLIEAPTAHPLQFFGGWVAAAVVSTIIVVLEMLTRSRRHHSRLADAAVHHAIEQFLPSALAAVFLGAFVALFAPDVDWMLPGAWQILTGLGIFASARLLPSQIRLVGGWYFVAGFVALVLAAGGHSLSEWTMGVPYVVGQTLAALVFHFCSGEANERS